MGVMEAQTAGIEHAFAVDMGCFWMGAVMISIIRRG